MLETNLLSIPENTSLRENNPYSVGSIFVFDDGSYLLDREPIAYEKSVRDSYYTTIDGDTLGLIAAEAYGNSKWWWILRDANDILALEPCFALESGTTILIPDLQKLRITSL